MAFICLNRRYLNRPYPSKTHRSGVYISTAITLRATSQWKITMERRSIGQKVCRYANFATESVACHFESSCAHYVPPIRAGQNGIDIEVSRHRTVSVSNFQSILSKYRSID